MFEVHGFDLAGFMALRLNTRIPTGKAQDPQAVDDFAVTYQRLPRGLQSIDYNYPAHSSLSSCSIAHPEPRVQRVRLLRSSAAWMGKKGLPKHHRKNEG